ncbi:MAG: hypothetical protein ACI8PZ_005051 [Myxococcota bacterium]|jgi:hypothetical protein
MFVALPALIVALGCALAALPLRAPVLLPPLRTAAVASALAVVFLGLLPEAVLVLGPVALVVVAAGLLLPMAMERAWSGAGTGAWTLAALALHQAVDGAQIAWLGPEVGAVGAAGIALHGAALSAAAVIALGRTPRRALGAAAVLVGATALGGLAGAGLSAAPVEAAEPWIRAAVSGLLLHALLHDVAQSLPETPSERAVDLLVAGAAASLGALTIGQQHAGHAHAHAPAAELLGEAMVHLVVVASPAVLLSLAATALVARLRGRPVQTALRTALDEVSPWVAAGLLMLAMITLARPIADLWHEGAAATAVVLAGFARVHRGPLPVTGGLVLWGVAVSIAVPTGLGHQHGPLGWIVGAVATGLFLWAVVRTSPRGWLRPLSDHQHGAAA